MAKRRRARFIPLTQLLQRRHPDLYDPIAVVIDGRVVVDGRTVTNAAASVRSDASLRIVPARRLRGESKLSMALDAFAMCIDGVIAVDIGAAAGGFTSALLDRGAATVYAVDVGYGQLVGRLRADRRVVNLERTNIAAIDASLVPEVIDLVTMDLSYLPVADAVGHVGRLRLASAAALVVLVKPTFELRSGSVVTEAQEVRRAIRIAVTAIESARWRVDATTIPAVTGAGGAIEAFVLARR